MTILQSYIDQPEIKKKEKENFCCRGGPSGAISRLK